MELHALGEHLHSLRARLAALRTNAATQRANAQSMGADAETLLNRKLWIDTQLRIKLVGADNVPYTLRLGGQSHDG